MNELSKTAKAPDSKGATHSPRKLAHIVLRTRTNFDEMVKWYQTVLGAQIAFGSDRIVFLSYDDEHHRIAIARSDAAVDRAPKSVGVDHIAFTYDGIEELLSTYARLKEAGILPFCNVNHGPTTSLYYADPDRNRIELQVDNFEDMGEATQLMEDNFGINPIGDEFDPDELLARLHAGAKPEELTAPKKATPPTMELITKLMSVQ